MKEYLREARTTPRNSRAFRQKTRFREKERCTNCEKSWKAVKIFQQRQPAIYRAGEGWFHETRLDLTVIGSPGDACPLRHSEGDVFY
jgi:hypothetical protein